jgi:hypothetical protein
MRDVLAFRSPLGVLGALVDRFVLANYLSHLLSDRGRVLKNALETAV